ncbi:pyridoxal phosphate-dependent aminotransferase [Cellulomonas sp. NTE-D12]|uniref:pyridoxal phosphate-dependent aminotransferase n=1 Tax=Cellulomonas sp. NTE-D12 TaxID=2962632 RepID=UPI003081A0AF|nr:aminotransferase [Cellulomonas sp. NTE-D12]
MHLAERSAPDEQPNEMARLRARLAADGVPVLDLSDSNPTRHRLTDPGVLEAVSRAVPAAASYEPDPHGPRAARLALAGRYGGAPEDYYLTASTSEAYAWLLQLLCDPGDAVAVPAPGYPLVEPLARLAGVRTVPYAVHHLHPYGWSVDTGQVADLAARPDVRAVVAVSPGNPTGAYLRAEERALMEAACRAGGAALVLDEVFAPFRLDAAPGDTVAAPASASERLCTTFTLDGLSKLVCAPQLKLSWLRVEGPAGELPAVHRALETVADTYLSVSSPVALALSEILDRADASVTATRARLAANLALAHALLDEDGFRVRRCGGGWTVLVDVPRYLPDEQLVLALLAEAHLAVHPGYFYDLPTPGTLALSLLPEPATFEAGCRRLRAAVQALA